MEEKRYIAHISLDGREQTVEEHLTKTAELCAGFAAAFNCGEQGRIIGAYHDIGKRSDEFQLRLRGGNIVDHASVGALECAKAGMEWASGCIIGHHGGLPDFGNAHMDDANSPTMCGRLHRALHGGIPKYSLPEKLSVIPSPNGYGKNKVNDSFLIRINKSTVAPRAGAWIEICCGACGCKWSQKSLPAEESRVAPREAQIENAPGCAL